MSKETLQQNLTNIIEHGIQAISLPETPVTLYRPIRYTLELGGKRIRPYLTLLASGMCGGYVEEALPAALSIEVLHNFTLIHDDIMDQAELRRGELAVHKKWDEATAILSGDAMFGIAYELLNHYGESGDYSKHEYLEIMKSFQYAVRTVCEGQALDLEFASGQQVLMEEYLAMIEGKTSALLSSALQMGAITAHAHEDISSALFEIGKDIGIAFQIQDDLLDAIADPEKFGKKAGGDIYEGKKTYLSLLALERANMEQRLFISNVLDKSIVTESEVEEVLELFHELGVIEETKIEIDRRYQSVFDALASFEESSYRLELEKLLIFLKERDH